MNKTININLGGFFFHIDESAYQKLKRYLDAIARSLSDDPQGKNEIIADIEARISELLSEKITDARQVVNDNDIDEIIAIMGQPEDYAEAEEGYIENSSTNSYSKNTKKKFFRDGSDKFLGGVCSGLGHFLGIDAIWIRLAFIILLASGFSPIAYIVLWILLPEARTTAEKLQMEGEPVNIGNIEKKIRNEFESLSLKLKDGANELSDKISSADYEKLRNQTKSGLQDFIETLGKILSVFFKIFGKFLGVILLFIAGATLISLIFGLFSVGSLEILNFDNGMIHYPPFFYNSIIPKGLLTTFLFLLIGIPFIALFVLGLRILSPNIKKLNTSTNLTLVGIWLVSLLTIGFSGIEHATSRAYEGRKVNTQQIAFNTNEPLKIAIKNDNDIYYQHNLRSRDNSVEVFVNDTKMKYSNDVRIDVEKSETGNAYVEIKKESQGKKPKEANENAEQINYKFIVRNNKITFDAYFLSDYVNSWKNEEVRLTLYVPEGTTIYFENSSKRFLHRIDNTDDIYDRNMANHHFKMTTKGFECLDCDEKNDTDKKSIKKEDNNNFSSLFDSTINDNKAEFIINKKTTKRELKKLIEWFKEKKNIDIEIESSSFDSKERIKKIVLNINSNDGHTGQVVISNNTLKDISKGFVRRYNEDGQLAFKIW